MAILVEHDKRKHEILQKSLDVFVEEGYEKISAHVIKTRLLHKSLTRNNLFL